MEDDIAIVIRRSKRAKEKSLDLSNRDLTSLPNSLYSLKHLEKLNLANNNLSHIST